MSSPPRPAWSASPAASRTTSPPTGSPSTCVVPGLIDTVRGHSTGGTPALHGSHKTLVGRRGRPEEVATVVRFLCGPQARFMTGQTLHANGGAYLP